jgi:polyhydroxyalkanoate synthase
VNEDLSTDADTWLGASKPVPGSWWNHWAAWAAPHGGGKVPARKISGSKKYPVIEPGPGRYVHAKAEPPTTEEKS